MLKKIRKLNGAETDTVRIQYYEKCDSDGWVIITQYRVFSKHTGNLLLTVAKDDPNLVDKLKDFGILYQILQTISLPELEAFADENMLVLGRKPRGDWMFIPINGIIPVDAEELLNENGYTLK